MWTRAAARRTVVGLGGSTPRRDSTIVAACVFMIGCWTAVVATAAAAAASSSSSSPLYSAAALLPWSSRPNHNIRRATRGSPSSSSAGRCRSWELSQLHQPSGWWPQRRGDGLTTRPSIRPRRTSYSWLSMAAWGPEPVWTPAQMIDIPQPACPSARSWQFTVEVPPDVSAGYTIPGQYVQLRLATNVASATAAVADAANDVTTTTTALPPPPPPKPLFLAIASPPDPTSNRFEFLIKKTNNNEWLMDPLVAATAAAAMPGQQPLQLPDLEISQVMGRGYAIQENLDGYKYDFPTQNILLFATGSGIAPIKAALESGQLNLGTRTARLYYGERTQDDLCYVSHFAAWEDAGIEVVPVLSRPTESSSAATTTASSSSVVTAWLGRSGYVQNALEEDGVAIPRNSAALLCGMKGMTDAVRNVLLQAGVFEGRILLNF